MAELEAFFQNCLRVALAERVVGVGHEKSADRPRRHLEGCLECGYQLRSERVGEVVDVHWDCLY